MMVEQNNVPRNNSVEMRYLWLEAWRGAYAQAVYSDWVGAHRTAGFREALLPGLAELGKDAIQLLDKAGTVQTRRRFDEATQASRALGVFGAPTLVVGGEISWLEVALAFAREKR